MKRVSYEWRNGFNSVDNERIFILTQSILATLVVVGGGAMMIFKPEAQDAVVGLVGMVIGFYFSITLTKTNGIKIVSQAQLEALGINGKQKSEDSSS